jgi:hypothetical protein
MTLLDFTTDWLTIYEPAMRDENNSGGWGIAGLLCLLILLIGIVKIFWYKVFPEWNLPWSKKWYNYFNK